jgi:hypothetical protein
MIEALSVESGTVYEAEKGNARDIIKFSTSCFGLKPALGTTFEEGPNFYPAPNFIDERIETRYLRIESGTARQEITHAVAGDAEGFSSAGRIREIDAQNLLNAISVGLIPNSRLEVQLLALYQILGIKAETWGECPLNIEAEEPEHAMSLQEMLKNFTEDDSRFREVKGTGGQLRMINSIFVDEGHANGGPTGLASRSMDFVVDGEDTVNTAVVLPLTRDLNGELLAGIVSEYLPVPQRYKGNGMVLTVPSFPLPKEIENMEQAARYLASELGIDTDKIARLGESYFCHAGVTPQRIFPFVAANVSVDKIMESGRTHGPVTLTPMYNLWKMIYWDCSESMMYTTLMAYCTLCKETEATFNMNSEYSLSAHRSKPLSLSAEQIFSNKSAGSEEIMSVIREGAKDEYSEMLLKEMKQSTTLAEETEITLTEDNAADKKEENSRDFDKFYGYENFKPTNE